MKTKWKRRIKELEAAVADLALDAEGDQYEFKVDTWEFDTETKQAVWKGKQPIQDGTVMIPTILKSKPIHPFVEPLARMLHLECVGGHDKMKWKDVGNDWRRFADWLIEDPDGVIHGSSPDWRDKAILKRLRKLGVCQYNKHILKEDSDEIHAKVVARVARWAYRMHCAKEMD